MRSNVRESLAADFHRLDVGIRQLKVQYDMFFAGALPREPFELRAELERIVKRYATNPPGRYADQFRMNSLISRFNSMAELWNKRIRAHEGGDQRHAGLLDKFTIRERLLARARVRDPAQNEAEIRQLHQRFADASREHGGKAPPFEKFASGIAAQTARLREKAGCAEIELRVVVRDDQVQVKARPGR
jgi:hypothetical protein